MAEEANGMRISLAELQSAVSILAMLVAGIAWGLKLEARIDEQSRIIVAIEKRIEPGILPIAAERLDALQKQIDELKFTSRSVTGGR